MAAFASSTFALQAPARDRALARREAWAQLQEMSDAMREQEGLLNYAQAGLLLDVSTKRISELVRLEKLEPFDFLGRRYVSMKQVRERYRQELKAGRPPMGKGKRLVASLKAAVKTDKLQARHGGYAGPYVRTKDKARKQKGKSA